MTKQPAPNNLPPISETAPIDVDAVLERTFAHPGLAPKRKPTIEQVAKVAIGEVEAQFVTYIKDFMEPQLEELVGAHRLEAGERDDCASTDDWESALDDKFEALLEGWLPWLSADWLGKNTIDSGLHEDGETTKMANKIAREVWKQTIAGRTVNQQLSSAGVTIPTLEVYFEQHLANAASAQPTETTDVLQENQDELRGVLAKIKRHVGNEFDTMEVYSDLELALDDDEILSSGGAGRLGIAGDDVTILAFILQDVPNVEDAAQSLLEQLQDIDPDAEEPTTEEVAPVEKPAPDAPNKRPTPPPPPPRASGAAPKPTAPPKPAAAPKAKAKGSEATAHNEVLSLYKQHGTSWGDTAMAEKLGVSRSTLNNYIAGKTACDLDGEQQMHVRDGLVAAINGLKQALGLIDGFDYDPVE